MPNIDRRVGNSHRAAVLLPTDILETTARPKAGYHLPMERTLAVEKPVASATCHDIPSLDGLRAISIAIVVLSHTKVLLPYKLAGSGLFRYFIGGGLHGVQFFFVISGYLITTLLVREFQRTRDISLRRFYARRALRIFPAFYAYLAVLLLFWIAGLHPEDRSTFIAAGTYTIVYHPHPEGWLVQHAWSLSIEEQFYLLWPLILLAAYRRGIAKRLAIAVLAAMPFVRAVLYLIFPDVNRSIVNCSCIDMLMVGCLLALLAGNHSFRSWCERWNTTSTAAALALLGLVLVPFAEVKLARTPFAALSVALAYSLTALSIAAILEYLVRSPRSAAGQVLNLAPLRHIGLISYSIYLWQQLFTENPQHFGLWTYLLILIAAELSFWLIEKPMMQLRARLAL